MNVNYKSDFLLRVKFDEELFSRAWRMEFYTEPEGRGATTQQRSRYFVASFDGEEYTNARAIDGGDNEVDVEFVKHGMTPGVLRYEMRLSLENEAFASGLQGVTIPDIASVVLVDGKSDDVIDPDVVAIVAPYIKGEKGDTGEQGEQGEQGERGEKGEKGDAGEQGEQGEPGVDGKDGTDGRDGVDGSTEAVTLLNSSVSITQDGVTIGNGTGGNVMAGLVAVLQIGSSNTLISSWANTQEFGDLAYFSTTYDSSNNRTTVKINGSEFNTANHFAIVSPINSTTTCQGCIGYWTTNSFQFWTPSAGGGAVSPSSGSKVYIFSTEPQLQ